MSRFNPKYIRKLLAYVATVAVVVTSDVTLPSDVRHWASLALLVLGGWGIYQVKNEPQP